MTEGQHILATLSVIVSSLAHVALAVIVLRLYQVMKNAGVAHNTWVVKLGMICMVTGTLNIAGLPLFNIDKVSQELVFWSVVKSSGMLLLCSVIFKHVKNLVRQQWDATADAPKPPDSAE
jgi:hypothetical protein